MSKSKAFLVLLVLSLSTAGCVSTKAVGLGQPGVESGPVIPWKQVAVYRSADQVPGPYREVALLISTGDASWSDEGNMWNSMKKKAAKLGANAIILDALSEPSAGAKVVSEVLLGTGGDRKGKAIAIYVLPAEKK